LDEARGSDDDAETVRWIAARCGGRQAIAAVFGGRSMEVGWFAKYAAESAAAQADRD